MRIETCSKCDNVPVAMQLKAMLLVNQRETTVYAHWCHDCRRFVGGDVNEDDVGLAWRLLNPPPPETDLDDKAWELLERLSGSSELLIQERMDICDLLAEREKRQDAKHVMGPYWHKVSREMGVDE